MKTVFDSLFGCLHTNYSFPRTQPKGRQVKAAQKYGTYVVCLDCGKEFPYNWNGLGKVDNGSKESESTQSNLPRAVKVS